MLYGGVAVNNLNIDAALKAVVNASVDVLGLNEATGQTAIAGLVDPTAKPFIFGQGITSIGDTDYSYVRSVSAKTGNNLKTDGYGQASLDRAYHARDLFAVSGDIKLRYAESKGERVKAGTKVDASILLVFYASEGKKVGASAVAEMMIIEVPYAQLDTYKREANGTEIDATASWTARKPGGTTYDPPFSVLLISADSAAY
jgi:hypothetical protein